MTHEAWPATFRVGWVGIEPTSGRIKNPLQSLRLLPTQVEVSRAIGAKPDEGAGAAVLGGA